MAKMFFIKSKVALHPHVGMFQMGVLIQPIPPSKDVLHPHLGHPFY